MSGDDEPRMLGQVLTGGGQSREISISSRPVDLPPRLAGALRDLSYPTMPRAVAADVRDEARRLLPLAEAACAPATARQWALFLGPLILLRVARYPEKDVGKQMELLARFLGSVPARVLTEARQAEATRRFHYWPSVKELAEWLEPAGAGLRDRVMALRRLAAAPVAARPEKAAAVQARALTDLASELRVSAMQRDAVLRDARKVRAAPVSVEARNAGYEAAARKAEAEGDPARAARLRLGIRPTA